MQGGDACAPRDHVCPSSDWRPVRDGDIGLERIQPPSARESSLFSRDWIGCARGGIFPSGQAHRETCKADMCLLRPGVLTADSGDARTE